MSRRTEALQRLFAWFGESGGDASAVRVEGEGDAELVLESPLPAHGLILRVPTSLIFDASAAYAELCAAGVRKDRVSASEAVIAAMALLRARADSRWAPYLNALPESSGAIACDAAASARVAALAAGTLLADEVAAHRARWAACARAVAGAASDLAAGGRGAEADAVRANAAWAFDMYWSRAIRVPAPGARGGNAVAAMVPVADLANHDARAGAGWGGGSGGGGGGGGGGVCLRAHAPLPAGARVRIPYGAESAAALAARFGFVARGSPAESAVLPGVGGRAWRLHRATSLPEGLLAAARADVAGSGGGGGDGGGGSGAAAAGGEWEAAGAYRAAGFHDAAALDWADPASLSLPAERVLPLDVPAGATAAAERRALDAVAGALSRRAAALDEASARLGGESLALASAAVREEAALVREKAALVAALLRAVGSGSNSGGGGGGA